MVRDETPDGENRDERQHKSARSKSSWHDGCVWGSAVWRGGYSCLDGRVDLPCPVFVVHRHVELVAAQTRPRSAKRANDPLQTRSEGLGQDLSANSPGWVPRLARADAPGCCQISLVERAGLAPGGR